MAMQRRNSLASGPSGSHPCFAGSNPSVLPSFCGFTCPGLNLAGISSTLTAARIEKAACEVALTLSSFSILCVHKMLSRMSGTLRLPDMPGKTPGKTPVGRANLSKRFGFCFLSEGAFNLTRISRLHWYSMLFALFACIYQCWLWESFLKLDVNSRSEPNATENHIKQCLYVSQTFTNIGYPSTLHSRLQDAPSFFQPMPNISYHKLVGVARFCPCGSLPCGMAHHLLTIQTKAPWLGKWSLQSASQDCGVTWQIVLFCQTSLSKLHLGVPGKMGIFMGYVSFREGKITPKKHQQKTHACGTIEALGA